MRTPSAPAHRFAPHGAMPRVAASHSDRAQLHIQLNLLEQQIEQLVDRIVKTGFPAAMTAYESRLAALETQKGKTADMIANCGRPLVDFDTAHRTAPDFLENLASHGLMAALT